jgi:hypothetical protein
VVLYLAREAPNFYYLAYFYHKTFNECGKTFKFLGLDHGKKIGQTMANELCTPVLDATITLVKISIKGIISILIAYLNVKNIQQNMRCTEHNLLLVTLSDALHLCNYQSFLNNFFN